MNRSSFNQVLTDPTLLDQLSISDLESVVKEYPWFSLAQVLLAKTYQSSGDARSTQQMAIAATQHANRMWMHQFVREDIAPSRDLQNPAHLVINKVTPGAPGSFPE